MRISGCRFSSSAEEKLPPEKANPMCEETRHSIHGSIFVYNKMSLKVPFMKYFLFLVAVLEFD